MNLKKGSSYIVFFRTNKKTDILAYMVQFSQRLQREGSTKFHHTGFAFYDGKDFVIRECRLFKGLCLYNLKQRITSYDGNIEIYKIDNMGNGSKKIIKDFNENKVEYGILNAIASITFGSKNKFIKILDRWLDKLKIDTKKSFCSKDTAYCFQLSNNDKTHQLQILIANKNGIDEITPQDLYIYCKSYCELVWRN